MTSETPALASRFKIVTDPDVSQQTLIEWALERMDPADLINMGPIGPARVFGILFDGEAVAVVIYNNFRELPHGNDIHVSIVAEKPVWCRPGVLRALFHYAFVTCGCERLTAIIRDGNERSLKLCKGLGFRKEGVVRRGYNGKTNAIVLGMLKHECTWLTRGLAHQRETSSDDQSFQDTKTATAARSNKSRGSSNGRKQRGAVHKRAHQHA
jgi:RimJ/RimL family protein N-acetyltransferase